MWSRNLLNGFLIFFLLISFQNLSLASNGQSFGTNINPKECIETLIVCDQKLTQCLNQQMKTSNELASCKGQKITLIDKLGFVGIGIVISITNFNPIVLIGSGYLILTQ